VIGRDGGLVFGFDGGDSPRHPMTPVGDAEFRVGEQAWAPERLRFDTVLDGHAQRAILSGGHYHRTFTD